MMMINIVNTKIMMVSKHITVRKTWFNGNFTSTHSFITYFSCSSYFIGMYLNNDHKDKNNNTADNKTEQTENKDKDKDKDNATNEKDQSNETAATKEDKSSESDNSTKKIVMSQMK